MEIRVATICDFAQVREGLLSVMSAGVNRIWSSQYPGRLGVMLALMFEVSPGQVGMPLDVHIRVEDADGVRLSEATASIQANPSAEHDPGEMLTVPLVVDFRDLEVPAPGRYQIVIHPQSEGAGPTALAFRAVPTGDGAGPERT